MKNKALIVAVSEFITAVHSKGFLLGLIMVPVFMAIAVGVQRFTRDATDVKDRAFVVVDRTGVLYGRLTAAAEDWNRASVGPDGAQTQPRFLPSAATFEPADGRARADLSDRVKRDEIFAFVEIPADALNPDTKASISYYSNHPGYRTLPSWIGTTVNREILNQRFRTASINRALVSRLTQRVEVSELGLIARNAAGTMLGKLLGSGGVSIVLAAIYMTGGVLMARHYGYGDAIRTSDLVWVLVFLSMAIVMFGSIFLTIGAACSDLKDAQGMMMPAMLLLMLPWMTWFSILNAPESGVSVALSLFPTATPFLMLLRIAIPPGPPMWHVGLGVALTAATSLALVHAAGKVFRTGLLMQGKAATLGEMWKWIRAD